MSALELPPVNADELSVSASHDDKDITVRFSGNADMRTKSTLDALLLKVNGEAQRLGAARVVIDFKNLEFMNSSCFKSFVSWISEVRDLDPGKQYRIHFLSKPELLWQRRSLHALRCFAVDLISIEG
jgi:anti-anti-sigma factor